MYLDGFGIIWNNINAVGDDTSATQSLTTTWEVMHSKRFLEKVFSSRCIFFLYIFSFFVKFSNAYFFLYFFYFLNTGRMGKLGRWANKSKFVKRCVAGNEVRSLDIDRRAPSREGVTVSTARKGIPGLNRLGNVSGDR